MRRKLTRLCVMLFMCLLPCKAQKVAVKTNLLWDAAATLNAGVEIGLAPRWTFDLSGNYNALSMPKDRRWRQLSAQPEVRYWLCERFAGHFFGFHAHGGLYNVANIENNLKFLGTDFSRLTDERFQGWFAGCGIGYGYSWILGRHWNLEAEVGFGYSYTRYDRYPCTVCGEKLDENMVHHYVGPTKLALSLVYLF